MGVNILLQAVDMECYRDRLIPAVRALAERGERAPVLELLRRAEPIAPDVDSRYDISNPEKNPEYVRRLKEAEKARESGNPKAARAFLAFLAELTARHTRPSLLTRRDVTNAMKAIGQPGPNAPALEQDVAAGLLEILCLPWDRGFSPILDVSAGPLNAYVSDRSSAIEKLLQGGVSGDRLELSTGESTMLFTREEVARLDAELAVIPRPSEPGWAQRDYDHLRAIVDLVRKNQRFALAFTLT